MLTLISRWYRPQLGRIDCHDWLRLQAVLAGTLRAYDAADILSTGYRVFEWGNGRHTRPTSIRRVFADGSALELLPRTFAAKPSPVLSY